MRFLFSVLILSLCAITPAAAQDNVGGSTSQSAPAAQDNSAKAKALIDQAIQALLAAKKIGLVEAQKYAVNKALFNPSTTQAAPNG